MVRILGFFLLNKKVFKKNQKTKHQNPDQTTPKRNKQLNSPLAMFLDLQETNVKLNRCDATQLIMLSSNWIISHDFPAACSKSHIFPAWQRVIYWCSRTQWACGGVGGLPRASRGCSSLWWPSDISEVQAGAAGAWGQIAEPQPSALRHWIKWNRGGNSWHTNGHVCLHPQINQFSAFPHCRQRQFVQQLPERKFTGQLKVLTFKQRSRGGAENYWVWNANRFNSFTAIYMAFTHSQLFSSFFFFFALILNGPNSHRF